MQLKLPKYCKPPLDVIYGDMPQRVSSYNEYMKGRDFKYINLQLSNQSVTAGALLLPKNPKAKNR